MNQKYSGFVRVVVMVLGLLLPYGYAVATGTADSELTGLARWHSAAESVYCTDGITSVSYILVAELLVLGTAVLGTSWLGDKSKQWQTITWYPFIFLILAALPFFVAWQTESSVCERGQAYFWESIFIDIFILSILAISYNLMFGFGGIVSFGHAAFFGTGAYAVGLFMLHLQWSWWLAVLVSLLLGASIALLMGFVGLRIKGLYFALFTLALAEVIFLLAGNRILVDLTGAEDGFTFTVPDWLNMTQNRLFFFYMVLVMLIAAFWLVRRLMDSPTGRVLHAMRDNEDRAQMIGYNTFHFKLITIMTSGVMATAAGVLRGLALKGASPNVLSLDFTMTPLLMTIIGGMGTFTGPVVGAFGLRLTEQFLRDYVLTIGGREINIGEFWAFILGVIFILSVMVFPQGIVGTWYNKQLHTRDGWMKLLKLK